MEEWYPAGSGTHNLIMVVYVLYSKKFNRYYIGHTNNIERRIAEHNEGISRSTAPYRPWELLATEKTSSRSEAMRIEKYLKSLKNKTRLQEYIAGWRSGTSRGS